MQRGAQHSASQYLITKSPIDKATAANTDDQGQESSALVVYRPVPSGPLNAANGDEKFLRKDKIAAQFKPLP